jgi:predicted acetyltransferase
MIIRKIKPEELKRTMELFSISFEFGNDSNKSAAEVFAEVTENPQSREDVYWTEHWAAFLDDDKTMTSTFLAQPFPVHFDGNVYTMTGIGGVATLPQYRRNGGIRGCFEAALPDMYANDVSFSYLYPFSTAYYRKFGYEMGCERTQYHVRLSSLKTFAVSGNCSLVEPGNFVSDDI